MKNTKENFVCTACDKVFTRKFNFDRHFLSCTKKDKINLLNQEIIKLKNELALKDQIIKCLQQKSNVEQVVKHVNMDEKETVLVTDEQPVKSETYIFSSERILNICKSVRITRYSHESTIDEVYRRIVRQNNKILYKCGDHSRRVFYYFDKDGNKIKDIKCTKLVKITKRIIDRYLYSLPKKSKKKYFEGLDAEESSESPSEESDDDPNKVYIWSYVETSEFSNHIRDITS